MDLDFRHNAVLQEEVSLLFDEVASSCKEKYNYLITSASNPLLSDVDWWSENTSSRDTFSSPLFHYVCCIELFKAILAKGLFIPSKVLVESRELLIILESVTDEYPHIDIEIIYKKKISTKFKNFIKNFYYEWFFLTRIVRIFLSKYIYYERYDTDSSHSLVLIDTFITSNFIHDDRWYGSFWTHLSEEARREVYFVPSIVDTSLIGFYKILKGIRYSERNNILKEDFLTLRDVGYAYLHKFRVKNLKIGPSFLGSTDVTNLLREDLLSNRDIHSTMEALLIYRFLKNLSLTSIKVRLSIDWFEGHSIDKIWNLGMYHFFPNTKRIGYETYRNYSYYLSIFPIEIERKAEVIPDVMAVQGPGCIETIQEYLPSQDVISVPAFKNEYIWEDHKYDENSKGRVLVALPISKETSARILDILIETSNKSISKDIIFVVKPHPAVEVQDIRKIMQNPIPMNFRFTEEKIFYKLLFQSALLVTEASSVCIEALAVGRPVIIIKNTSGLSYDPIPKGIPENMYMHCKSSPDLELALNKFLSLSQNEISVNLENGRLIREEYFEPFTQEGLNRFLDLGN